MEPPLCVDGTREHTWVSQPGTARTGVSQCMVCGAKEIVLYESEVETIRYARAPLWGFAGLPPDDERPVMPPQTDVGAIPLTAKERARDALIERLRRGMQ